MINILFDLISIQGYHSGGGEYVLKVLKELSLCSEANIIGIYDSKLNFLMMIQCCVLEKKHFLIFRSILLQK